MNKLIYAGKIETLDELEILIHRHKYIDITAKQNENNVKPVPKYWTLGDPKYCLIEIGIDPDTGVFISLTVVSLNGKLEKCNINIDSKVKEKVTNGMPKFSLNLWEGKKENDRFFDVSGRFRLQISGNYLRVLLFDENIILRTVVCSNKLSIELNESDELISVIYELNEKEIAALVKIWG